MNLQRELEYYKKHGLWKTLIHQLKTIIYYESNTIIFFELDLENSDFKKKYGNSEYKFITLNQDNYKNSEYIGWEISGNEALIRFQKGYILFAALKDNILISQNWSEPNKAIIEGLKLKIYLPKSTIYTSRLYTIPDYRGKGLATKTKLYMLKSLKDYGFKKAFLIIEEGNKVSQAVNQKFGFEAYQKIRFYRFIYFLKVYIVREYNTNRKVSIIKIRKTDSKIFDMFTNIKKSKN
jgi:RimJ/RimL family protein N-acetyltransferase